MRQGFRALAAAGLGLAVSFVAACGSNSGLLTSSDSSSLSGLIQQVSADVKNGNCSAVPDDLNSLTQAFDSLPSSINSSLKTNLADGVQRVKTLALQRCPSATSTSVTTPTTITTTTKTTKTTPTTTTATTTTPTQTITTPPTNTATTPANPGTTSTGPGSGGAGLGGAGGNGNGNGNGNGHGG